MWTKTITDFVCAGDRNGALLRLELGDDINERRSNNYTPLIYAAFYNKCEMIELLLDKGADIEAVDKSGLSALRTAIYYRKEEAAVLLAQRGANGSKVTFQQMTALYAAVHQGQTAVVKALLENGADPAVVYGPSQYTPLINAAYYNKCDMIGLLLESGADIDAVNKNGLSPLRTAIYYKQREAALLLAKRGAEANTLAYQSTTALFAAVEKGWADVVKALLMNGANPLVVCGNKKSVMNLTTTGEISTVLKIFTDLDTALSSRTCPAVKMILKNLVAKEVASDIVLSVYKSIVKELESALGDWRQGLREIADKFQADMLNYALLTGSEKFVDCVGEAVAKRMNVGYGTSLTVAESSMEDGSEAGWMATTLLNENGQGALHVGASLGNADIVSLLLDKYNCDSVAVDDFGKTPSQLVSKDENYTQTRKILEIHEKRTRFMNIMGALLLQNEVTMSQLLEMARNMTSIYDLRTLFLVAYQSVTEDKMKELTKVSFKHAVEMKLMYDNDAAVFFKNILRECQRLKLITRDQKDHWKLEATKVNVENSDFIRKIQNSIAQLEHRVSVTERNILTLQKSLESFREALKRKEQLKRDRKRTKQLLMMVSGALILVGGPLLDKALDYVFDSCALAQQILKVLKEIETDMPESAILESALKHVGAKARTELKARAEAALLKAFDPSSDFVRLMDEVLTRENPDDTLVESNLPHPTKFPGHSGVPVLEMAESPSRWLGLPYPTLEYKRAQPNSSLEDILGDYVQLYEERLLLDSAADMFNTTTTKGDLQLRDLENVVAYAAPQTLSILFHQFDQDNSGTIDSKELLSIVRHVNYLHGVCSSCSIPVPKTMAAFQCSMCKSCLLCVRCYPNRSRIHPQHSDHFLGADVVDDVLSLKADFPQNSGTILQNHVNILFDEADSDGDGAISFDEFTSFFMENGVNLDFIYYVLSFDLECDGQISRHEALYLLTGLEMLRSCDECGKTSFVCEQDILSCIECTENYDVCVSCRSKGQSSHVHDHFEVAKPFQLRSFGLFLEHTSSNVWRIAVGDSQLWETYKPFVGDRVGKPVKIKMATMPLSPDVNP